MDIDRLMMCCTAGARISAPSFNVLVSIKSTPVAEEFRRPLISSVTSPTGNYSRDSEQGNRGNLEKEYVPLKKSK